MRICSLTNSVPFKKNPFLGRELICFANPGTPGGLGEAGETAEGGKVFEDLKDALPGRMEYNPDQRWEIQQHWVALVGDYNGVQNNINNLLKSRKELLDDKVFNKPNFRQQFQALVKPKYQELQRISTTLGTMHDVAAINRIRENAMNELSVTRGDAIKDTDAVIHALLAERKEKFRLMHEMMKVNLTDRLRHLKTQWETDPPNAYMDVRDEWIEYCVELIDTVESQDVSGMDTGDPEFPQGNELYKDAKKWWDMVSQIEDSFKDFKNADNDPTLAELSDEKLLERYTALKEKVEADLSGGLLEKFNKKADEMLSKASRMRGILEKKLHQLGEDEEEKKEEKKFLKDQIKTLDDKVKELNLKKDLKEMVKDAFTSTEELAKFPPDDPQGKPVPKGLEGQLNFLRTTGLSTAARRAMARSMFEGMKGIEKNVDSYREFAEVQAVEAIENMRIFEESLDTDEGKVTKEIMLVNPFETMGHFWHSVTTTIKGNVETDAKRGAGYFQRDATKILTKIPAPFTKLNVIKSLTELHPNGAQEAEHAEHGRVSEIEKGYEAFNTEHLQHLASETIDRWEFKACLNLLAKRGRVDFYAPWLFVQLNKWQTQIKMPTDRYFHQKNLTASDEMLRQAFVYIYRDSEGFKTLKNTNASSYESKMGEFSKNWGSIAAEPGALVREAEKILSLYEADHHAHIHFSKADPIKFESIIRYAVDQGKMKAEQRMGLLARGIASGLLPFDRGVNATDKNNTYPPFDWFDAPTSRGGRPTIDDIKEMAAYAKDPVAWDVYMNGEVNYSRLVNERLDKTMSQGSHRVDHDDAPMLAGHLKVGTRRDLFTQKTAGGYGMPITGLLSLSTGDQFWLDLYAEKYSSRDRTLNNQEIVRFATSFLMGEGIMNRRVYKGQNNFFRLEPDTAAKPPRAGGSYAKVFGRDENEGVGSILKGVAGHLAKLDFDKNLPLLNMMINDKIKTNEDAKAICKQLEDQYGIFKGSPPDTIDKLYDSLSMYLEYAVEHGNTDGVSNVELMTRDINAEHSQNIHDILHHAEHDVEHTRKNAALRSQGLPEEEH